MPWAWCPFYNPSKPELTFIKIILYPEGFFLFLFFNLLDLFLSMLHNNTTLKLKKVFKKKKTGLLNKSKYINWFHFSVFFSYLYIYVCTFLYGWNHNHNLQAIWLTRAFFHLALYRTYFPIILSIHYNNNVNGFLILYQFSFLNHFSVVEHLGIFAVFFPTIDSNTTDYLIKYLISFLYFLRISPQKWGY